MNAAEARVEVGRILSADLRELTDQGRLAVFPPASADGWDLPELDRLTLRSHGLPATRSDDLIGIVGAFQEGRHPELTESDDRLYRLGKFGEAQIAATAGPGMVLAIPKYREVHPALRHLHPAGITADVVNSSAASLVDCAWRWHWLVSLLAEQEQNAGQAELEAWKATTEETPDFYADYKALCEYVLQGFQTYDTTVGTGSKFWVETISEFP